MTNNKLTLYDIILTMRNKILLDQTYKKILQTNYLLWYNFKALQIYKESYSSIHIYKKILK
jgi:hypothetical protein